MPRGRGIQLVLIVWQWKDTGCEERKERECSLLGYNGASCSCGDTSAGARHAGTGRTHATNAHTLRLQPGELLASLTGAYLYTCDGGRWSERRKRDQWLARATRAFDGRTGTNRLAATRRRLLAW